MKLLTGMGTRALQLGAWVLVLLSLAVSAHAADYGDVTVTAQPPPHGNTWRGYVEIRAQIGNHSTTRSHEITLNFPYGYVGGYGDTLSRVSRTVKVGPGASAQVPIWVPALPTFQSNITVIIDGRRQEEVVAINSIEHGSRQRYSYGSGTEIPTLLISRRVSQTITDAGENSLNGRGASGSGKPGPVYAGSSGTGKEMVFIRAELESAEWSQNWLAHTAYSGVLLTGEELRAMAPPVREALWQYVTAGGLLIVIGSADLPRTWAPGARTTKAGETPEASPLLPRRAHTAVGLGYYLPIENAKAMESWSDSDWADFRTALVTADRPWMSRWNLSDAVTRFPIVEKVTIPARGLLGLVIFFALLIGPLNAFVLSKMQRRIWMLWTVPLLSIVMSMAVFGYGALSEGWGARARSTYITLLDQTGQMATTFGMTGYYAPLTPRDGLHFPSDTEITPILTGRPDSGQTRTMDWSVDQHLDTGWISARVPSYFMIRRSERRMERLTVTRDSDNSLKIVNGLGARITGLAFVDAAGVLYTSENLIEPGASSKLTLVPRSANPTPPATTHSATISRLILGSWPEVIQGLSIASSDTLAPGSYLAILDATPFVPDALPNVKEHIRHQVVIGLLDMSAPGSTPFAPPQTN